MMFYGPPGTYERGGPLKPGDAVLYGPSPGTYFEAFIDSEIFLCGETPCVRLRGLPREYGEEVGHNRNYVKAAAVHACWVKKG